MRLYLRKVSAFLFMLLPVLFIINLVYHDIFHLLVTLFTIFIGVLMFVVAINEKGYYKGMYILPLGIVYLYIGILDFLHIIHILGVDSFEISINIATQYWVTARLVESIAFLGIFLLVLYDKKLNYIVNHLLYVFIIAIAIYLVGSNIIPNFYIDGNNISIALIIGLSLSSILFLGTIFLVIKITLKQDIKYIIITVLTLKILSNIVYIGSFSNETYLFVGHTLQFISYVGMYVIFVKEAMQDSYKSVIKNYEIKQNLLKEKASRDALTGLYNHTTIFNKIKQTLSTCDESLAIIMIDIDNFKDLNDQKGHQFGDKVLSDFAGLIYTCDIPNKVVGRYGGDEFIICIPNTTKEYIDKQFMIIRKRIDDLINTLGVSFTFSAGITFYEKDDNVKSLIYKADMSMYQAKHHGKNQYKFYEKSNT